jgi:hypothetical protein
LSWIDFGIFLNLFFNSHVLFKGKLAFEFYDGYVAIIILLLIFIAKYRFPRETLYILLPLLITGIMNVILGNNTTGNLIKIFANLAVNLIFYRYVMHYYNYDVKRIFSMYLKGSFIVAVLGLIQLGSYIVGFEPGYDWRILFPLNKWGFSEGGLGIRINSTLSEPAYFGTILAPAFFFSCYEFFFKREKYLTRYQSITIIIAYVLSFSSLAFLGVFISIILLAINFGFVRYILIAVPVSAVLFFLAYNNAPEFRARVNGMEALFIDNIVEKELTGKFERGVRMYKVSKVLPRIHGSSFVLYNNYHVTMENFKQNPLFGSGLGSHELAYQKHKLNYLLGGIYEFNTHDANSMFLRTLSEVGLMGVIFILFFVFKFYVSKNLAGEEDNDYWLISNALLVLITIQLLRQGNYTFSGFFLYAWMYYYNFVNYKNYTSEKSAEARRLREENESNIIEETK